MDLTVLLGIILALTFLFIFTPIALLAWQQNMDELRKYRARKRGQ